VPHPVDEAAWHKFATGIDNPYSRRNRQSYVEEIFDITGLPFSREEYWLRSTTAAARAKATELLPKDSAIGLNIGAGRRWPSRIWPVEFWIELIELDWRADINPFQTTLGTVVAENPSAAPDVDTPLYALCERTAPAAARALTNYPRDGVTTDYGVNCPRAYWEGVVARGQGDSAKTRAAFIAARSDVEKLLAKQPDFAVAISLLGVIDAGLGRKEQALQEGHRACELLPISKDAISGVALAVNLAQIYTWTDEKDRAIEQIAAVERVPNELSYGLLKLHPYWDSLRGDPRFEKIVASLAPK
jgi:hypothetical protein